MLKIGLQTYFLDFPVDGRLMIKQFRIPFGLKMGSSILTRRARKDANAPEASLEARWRDRLREKWAELLP